MSQHQRLFEITTQTNSVAIPQKGNVTVSYNVANVSGRYLRGKAEVVPLQPEAAAWMTLHGDAERMFPISGTNIYDITLAPPASAKPGSYTYTLRLDMVNSEAPDDSLHEGQVINFTAIVPEPEKPPEPVKIPIPLIIGVIVALVVIIGIIVAVARDRAWRDQFIGVWQYSEPNTSYVTEVGFDGSAFTVRAGNLNCSPPPCPTDFTEVTRDFQFDGTTYRFIIDVDNRPTNIAFAPQPDRTTALITANDGTSEITVTMQRVN